MSITLARTQNVVLPSVLSSISLLLSKIAPIFIGACIAFALFVLMAKLIEQDTQRPVTTTPVQIGSIVFEEPDEHTIVKTIIKPKPKAVPPPTPLPSLEPAKPDNKFTGRFSVNNTIEKIKVEPNINTRANTSARPVVRVNPRYPIEAANKGLEGWVQLRFNIAPDGSVRDIKVVDSQPKRVFDNAAIRALKRWKYKPSVKQGKSVMQEGMSVVLDFSLES